MFMFLFRGFVCAVGGGGWGGSWPTNYAGTSILLHLHTQSDLIVMR